MPRVDGPVDYDDFAQSDRSMQVGLFNAITAENRAAIVRAQITRWLAINESQLTQEQIDAVNAALAVVTEELYRHETPAWRRSEITEPVFKRLESLLSREQMWRCIAAGAPHIPRRPSRSPGAAAGSDAFGN